VYENIGQYYWLNGQKAQARSFILEDMPDNCIYEVIRVKNHKLLFFEDHMDRLQEGMINYGLGLDDLEIIKQNILQLVVDHEGLDKNIKIDVAKDYYRIYYVKSKYPSKALYDQGVKTVVMDYERHDPQQKVLNMDYKRQIEAVKGQEYFEVLLMDHKGMVTEGSRSNLVFVKDNHLISAPLSCILHGVTFKNIILLADQLNIDLLEEGVSLDDLDEVDACFLTGTSLGVLPIQSVNDRVFKSSENKIVRVLMKAYEDYVNH